MPEQFRKWLFRGDIEPADVPNQITQDICTDESNIHALLEFFEGRIDLGWRKDTWMFGDKSEEISLILQKNTLSQGHGISKLRDINALSDVLPAKTLNNISALEETVKKIFQFQGANDVKFWKQLVKKYRKTKLREILMQVIFALDFTDEQLAKVVGNPKYLRFVPEEKRFRIASML